jgi:hypothetical protein
MLAVLGLLHGAAQTFELMIHGKCLARRA